MKSWASSTLLGVGRRQHILRGILAVALVGGLVWALPVRRPGQEGGHHGAHGPALGFDQNNLLFSPGGFLNYFGLDDQVSADAYYAALMERLKLTEIVTFDADFHWVPGITRVEPS